jgi:hypothetical protein
MKHLLIILIIFFASACKFKTPSFDEIGGILYTFQLPNHTTPADVHAIENILKKRIANYVRQTPTFEYDKAKQRLSVGVPKSLTSKNAELSKALLSADGSFEIIEPNISYFELMKKMEMVHEDLKENPMEWNGEKVEQHLFDVLEPIPLQQSMPFLGVAIFSDTALVMAMLQEERFRDTFQKDLYWAWKVNKNEMKAYLHAYVKGGMKVEASAIEEISISTDKSIDYFPTLSIKLDEKGKKLFANMTAKAASTKSKSILHIFISQQLYMSLMVQSPLIGGRIQITSSDVEDILLIKSILEAGRLPVDLKCIGEEER